MKQEKDNTVVTDNSHVFEAGNKVHYVATHLKYDKIGRWNVENGIVKRVTDAGVFVVYHCAGEWSNYENYTAALTDPKDLRHGWLE